ncbi:hypothetical protein ON010_g13526 [Phytophthora cinnamomi]|nr:hypothetical protein ON010_g13526 [Phytophthora cinnamomi]
MFRVATGDGHSEVMQYLFGLDSREAPGLTFDLMRHRVVESAARSGQLGSIEWLFAHRFECSEKTIEIAARSGHLDVVQWLHDNTSAKRTTNAMDLAAKNGYAEVVKWFYKKSQSQCCSRKAFDDGVRSRHFSGGLSAPSALSRPHSSTGKSTLALDKPV